MKTLKQIKATASGMLGPAEIDVDTQILAELISDLVENFINHDPPKRNEGTPIQPPSSMTDDELAFAYQCGGSTIFMHEIFARWKATLEKNEFLVSRLKEVEGTPL